LALARAVLTRPSVLILDDATSAVDPTTEQQILDALDSELTGRTVFLVAHRLSTLRRADLIVVLEQGRVAQVGTHDELFDRDGHYREAALLQLGTRDFG
jgi:ABC-type multidrug transport system fused ATPase/permease subunit